MWAKKPKISSAKREVQCISRDTQPLSVHLHGSQLYQTDDFVYLVGTISSDVSSDKDIDRR